MWRLVGQQTRHQRANTLYDLKTAMLRIRVEGRTNDPLILRTMDQAEAFIVHLQHIMQVMHDMETIEEEHWDGWAVIEAIDKATEIIE